MRFCGLQCIRNVTQPSLAPGARHLITAKHPAAPAPSTRPGPHQPTCHAHGRAPSGRFTGAVPQYVSLRVRGRAPSGRFTGAVPQYVSLRVRGHTPYGRFTGAAPWCVPGPSLSDGLQGACVAEVPARPSFPWLSQTPSYHISTARSWLVDTGWVHPSTTVDVECVGVCLSAVCHSWGHPGASHLAQ